MRVHHLNCISTCPLGGRLMDGRTQALVARGELCCHCLLVEPPTVWCSSTRAWACATCCSRVPA